jgi:hypothetical protein
MGAVAARNQAEYEADIHERNAAAARAQAQEEAARFRVAATRRKRATLAAQGASGFVASVGSPLEVLGDMATSEELDALTIEHGGDVRSANLRAQARVTRMGATSALIGGLGQAGGTLLGGVARHEEMFG